MKNATTKWVNKLAVSSTEVTQCRMGWQ